MTSAPAEPLHLERIASFLRWLWPVALVTWVFLAFGPLGFNPTDDGYVLAQAWRILHGQVPHRDIISPRPLGSAFLHLVDFALPLPLFPASRLTAVAEVTAYTLCFAAWTYRAPFARWTFAQSSGAAGAVLVNLHVFPLMAWYTIDGLLLTAAGLVLVDRGLERGACPRLGLLCLGAGPLVKQSFLLAPVMGLVLVFHRTRGRRLRESAGAALVMLLPGILYAGAIAALGGLPAMQTQLGAAAMPAWEKHLLGMLSSAPSRAWLLGRLGTVAALYVGACALGAAARRVEERRPGGAAALGGAGVAAGLWLSWVVVHIPIDGRLAYFRGTWGLTLTLALALILVLRSLLAREIDGRGLALVAAAWMGMLSWGYAMPNLVAGSVALCLLVHAWSRVPLERAPLAWLRLPLAATALAATVTIGCVFSQARDSLPYHDLPRAQLTAALRPISPAFGFIRTNPTTGRYLEEIAGCMRRFPARRVAVLPDNPGIYPALGLRNPFPVDWMLPAEYAGAEEQILEATRRLGREGDYLVLFQPFNAFSLPTATLQPATPKTGQFFWFSRLLWQMLPLLRGNPVACGPFRGAYAAPTP